MDDAEEKDGEDEDAAAEPELEDGLDGREAVDQQRKGGGEVRDEQRVAGGAHRPPNAIGELRRVIGPKGRAHLRKKALLLPFAQREPLLGLSHLRGCPKAYDGMLIRGDTGAPKVSAQGKFYLDAFNPSTRKYVAVSILYPQ